VTTVEQDVTATEMPWQHGHYYIPATAKGLSEDEAISLMSVAVDFGVTQVVDANWGIHAVLKKAMFGGDKG
jgi:acetamidase/formamidase